MVVAIGLHDLFETLRRADLKDNIGVQKHRFAQDLRQVPVTDFFGSTTDVHLTTVGYYEAVGRSVLWWILQMRVRDDDAATLQKK